MNYDIYNDEIIPFVSGSRITINVDLNDIMEEPIADPVISSINWKMAKYGESESLVTKTLDNGITQTGNIITIELNSSDTANFSGFFDHQITIIDRSMEVFKYKLGHILMSEGLK